MSRKCAICGKAPSTGHRVSHSNKKSGRWFYPNLVKVRIKDPRTGRGKRIWVCTSCLKAGKVYELQMASGNRA